MAYYGGGLNCVTLAKLWSTPALDHAHAVRLRQLAHLVVEARDPAPYVGAVRLFPRPCQTLPIANMAKLWACRVMQLLE